MSIILTDETLTEVTNPTPFPGINRVRLGAPIEESDRLSLFSDKQFEVFVQQWAFGYLKNQYNEVQRRAGAGDKGRDVIAWIDPQGTSNRKWDNYQCKHYDHKLTPTDIWVELGKLCYYTFIKHYTPPQNYKFITHKGIGPKLGDMLAEPENLRKELISNWDGYCRKEITKTKEVPLEGNFRAYVEAFDFSIVSYTEPLKLLEEHKETRYHAHIFGTGLKPRLPFPQPSIFPADNETRYIAQIYEAFSSYLRFTVKSPLDFSNKHFLVEQFNQARISFYCAESLKEFARDNLLDDLYFSSLMNQFYSGICYTANNPHHKDGLERMIKTIEMAQTLIVTHVLCDVLESIDRTGICHHLANEDKVRWVVG